MALGKPWRPQIIVVDFEYASPNPAAFDIANHFHEWTANYHSDTPHLLDPTRYPSPAQRSNFYRAYLTHAAAEAASSESGEQAQRRGESETSGDGALAAEMERLESQVRAWSPAAQAMWAVWGVVQAREFVEGQDGEPEFDYLGHAQHRVDAFRRELVALGVPGVQS